MCYSPSNNCRWLNVRTALTEQSSEQQNTWGKRHTPNLYSLKSSFLLWISMYTDFQATNLVDGATKLSRRHADNNTSALKSGYLLFSSTLSPSNDCSSMTHPPAWRSSQTSYEWHYRLGIWTLWRKKGYCVTWVWVRWKAIPDGRFSLFFFKISTSQAKILNS